MSADEVQQRVFRSTVFREGYDPDDVDDLLDLVEATLRGEAAAPLTADDLRNARFGITRFREGYDQDEVDAFIDALADDLDARAS